MFNCCSHGTLLHFGLQISCLNICNYHQDLSSECVCVCERERVSVCVCVRSEEHTSELQSHLNLVCRLLLEKKHNTRGPCGAERTRRGLVRVAVRRVRR